MSPGYDRPDPEDFRRSIPYDCLFCHNGYPPQGQVSDMRSDEPTFSNRPRRRASIASVVTALAALTSRPPVRPTQRPDPFAVPSPTPRGSTESGSSRSACSAIWKLPVRCSQAPFPNRQDGDLYLALAQVLQESNLARGISRLEQVLAKYKPETPEFYFDLGRAFSTAGNWDEADHVPGIAATVRGFSSRAAGTGGCPLYVWTSG